MSYCVLADHFFRPVRSIVSFFLAVKKAVALPFVGDTIVVYIIRLLMLKDTFVQCQNAIAPSAWTLIAL